MEAIDVVHSGGGSGVACLLGAHAALKGRYSIEGAGGTSAGAVIAAGEGCGLTPAQMVEILIEVFAGGVLDASPFAWPRFGWHKGDKIHAALKKHLPGKMKDLKIDVRIVVADLWTGKPLIVTRDSHPDALVADVVRASLSIPVFFAATRLEQNNARLYVDGGCCINFAHDAFDDTPRRTIGVRLDDSAAEIRPVREGNFLAYIKGMARLFMYSSNNAHISHKKWADIITVKTTGDCLDFSLDSAEIRRRLAEGVRAVG